MAEWKKSADAVIIGSGVQGCSLAYNLAKLGIKDVVVLEKDSLCSGSSGRCGAGIRAQWGTEMNCRLGLACLENFENLEEELGMKIDLHQGGYIMIAYGDKEYQQLKQSVGLQNRMGIASRELSREEACEIAPGLWAEDAAGFFYHDRDGHADPFLTTYAYHEAAKRLGVTFLKFTECTGIKVDKGRVAGVETTRGEIDTPVVVNCAGGYAQQVAKMAGIELPNYSERHQIIVTEPVEYGLCPPMLMSFTGNFYIQQRPNGSIIGGCSPEGHPDDMANGNTWEFLEKMSRKFTRLLPATREVRVVRQWSGQYNMTPDKQPILGEADGIKGFYLSVGYSGHGFMFATITGPLMAELINGQEPSIPIEMLHYRRFAKGELILEPAVV
ncbi:MAG: FAD-binding oxidoreductase [Synergistales bacterium]|nr:FAD-binding oxidoreductase [Synergistales bacterium]